MYYLYNNGEYYAVDPAANAAYWTNDRSRAKPFTYEQALQYAFWFGGNPQLVTQLVK